MVSLQEQRARMEDSILAEVKIEVAAIAQDRKLDVVLTRLVANVAGIDITTDVIQKLKR
jgi:Skp family chaperone for outer membrane proteins